MIAAVISPGASVIVYPATIQTKGSTAGISQVVLQDFDNYDQIYFNYDATLEMGSTTKLNIKGSTLDGDKLISNEQLPGDEFTRVITQKVTKSRDASGILLSVYLQTTLKLTDGKEKYGKTTIGVRVAPGPHAPHYWDIKHEYSTNYEGGEEAEICLGCDDEEEQIVSSHHLINLTHLHL